MRPPLLLLLALAAAAAAARTPLSVPVPAAVATAAALPEGATILFTLLARNATLAVGADPAHPDAGVLDLGGVSPRATWFAERPVRRAGVLTTAALAGSRSLTSDDEHGAPSWLGAPNLALTGTNEAGGEVTAVVTVRGAPTYDGGARTLTAAVEVIPQAVPPGSQAGGPPVAVAGDGKIEQHVPDWAAELADAAWKARRAAAAAARVDVNAPTSPAAVLRLRSVALVIDQAAGDAYLLMPGAAASPPPPPPPPPSPSTTTVVMPQCLSSMSPGCAPWSGWYPGYGYDYVSYPGMGAMGGFQTGAGGASGVAYGGMGVGLAG